MKPCTPKPAKTLSDLFRQVFQNKEACAYAQKLAPQMVEEAMRKSAATIAEMDARLATRKTKSTK